MQQGSKGPSKVPEQSKGIIDFTPAGIIDFTPVLHTEFYSRRDCGHFVDLEKWDYIKQIFKYAAVLAVTNAVAPLVDSLYI